MAGHKRNRAIVIIICTVFLGAFLCPNTTTTRAVEPNKNSTVRPTDSNPLIPIEGVDLKVANEYNFASNSIAQIIDQFRFKYGLSNANFSMSYELSDGSLRYDFAENIFRVAASTYKLPLNLYYYDLEQSGQIPSTEVIGGWPLSTIHRESIVNSNNEMSEALFARLGSVMHYRELMTQYCDQVYPNEYYIENKLNSAYMIPVLRRIYENSDKYSELISYMKEATPGRYFKNNSDNTVVAHKYGYYGGATNDVGIIYAQTPYFLSVYTANVSNADYRLGELASLLTNYTNYRAWQQKELVAQIEALDKAEKNKQTIHQDSSLTTSVAYNEGVARAAKRRHLISLRYIAIIGIVSLWSILFCAKILNTRLQKQKQARQWDKLKFYSIRPKQY